MPQYELDERAILLRPGDDVAVVTTALDAGDVILRGDRKLEVRSPIPVGHKVALNRIGEGCPVRKYEQVIGFSRRLIEPGDHVHTHNLSVGKLDLDYQYATDVPPVTYVPPKERRTFMGYPRRDGRAGTRNYIAIVSTANCSANVCKHIAERFRGGLQDYPNVDGVAAFTHKRGCGMNICGEELPLLQRTLAGVIRHPNVAGALLVGLGCEVNQVASMMEREGLASRDTDVPLSVLVIQEQGGAARTVEAGVEHVVRMLAMANSCERTRQPLSKLVLGTNCGGSDAYSGITANPALGWASDELARHGGTSVLAETPETYGAEHLLTRRAVSREVGLKLVELMRWWERYTAHNGAQIDNNPSPGNKAGGLTTVYEKSLGAMAKGGTGPLVQVYGYAEQVTAKGFVFMDTPGHDPTSVTGLVAGGANLIAFTTGRGSVLGCKPSPCVKISTTTDLYERMSDDMDLDAGVILNGASVADVGREIFEKIVSVASGERTKSESQGLGDEEFDPWVQGATL